MNAAMLRADGKDIVKRSTTRKNRYLLVFNMRLAPAAAGKLVRRGGRRLRTRPPAAGAAAPSNNCCTALPNIVPNPRRAALHLAPPLRLCRARWPSWTAATRCCTSTSRRGATSYLVRGGIMPGTPHLSSVAPEVEITGVC